MVIKKLKIRNRKTNDNTKMSIKELGAMILAKHIRKKINKWARNPLQVQEEVFKNLIRTASNTAFGRDHGFNKIQTHSDFITKVPIRDYEGLKGYVDRVVEGEKNVLWPGLPIYFAKTSGTTSGVKYIPLTKASIPTHIKAARNSILCYMEESGKSEFVNGKMMFLQGSPELAEKNGIKLGRLSGIVAHYVPKYLQKNRMPSWDTNCIEDWDKKVDAIVEETVNENMTVIGGIPPWVQMYFEKLKRKTGKPIGELFKNLELFIYGGVNFEPYKSTFEKLIGKKVAGIELYPASEGFFAFQDKQKEKGMLLQLDSGIFYEFVKAETFFEENPKRLTIGEVEKGVNYVMLISTNAGLWFSKVKQTIVGIFIQQAIEDGAGQIAILREVVALAHVFGALPAGQRFLLECDVADEIEGIEGGADFILQGGEDDAVALQFLDDGALLVGVPP